LSQKKKASGFHLEIRVGFPSLLWEERSLHTKEEPKPAARKSSKVNRVTQDQHGHWESSALLEEQPINL
jgi:hypothetical protein